MPPVLSKNDAIIFALGEFFLPGISTIIYAILRAPTGKQFERNFAVIGR